MLTNINRFLDKIMPLLTPGGVLLGICLSQVLNPYQFLSTTVFAFITLVGSLRADFRSLVRVISQPFPLIITLLILHVVMPILALGLGHLLFADDEYTVTGIVLAASIPTGITSLLWVTIYRGNIVLTLSIILADTLLTPLIVPSSLYLLVNAKVHIDIWAMMKGLLYMIVLPSILGMALHRLTKGRVHEQWSGRLAPFSKLAVVILTALNGAAIAPILHFPTMKLFGLAVFVLLFASLGYVLGWVMSRMFRWERDISVAVTFNAGMRSNGAGAVLVTTYFTAPAVAVPVVVALLLQQTIASIFGYLLYSVSRSNKLQVSAEKVS